MPRYRQSRLIDRFAALSASERPAALTAQLAQDPSCPVTRYLLACHCIDRGRLATAVRHFMVAHHSEPQYQSAALLVFAGLCSVQRRDEALLPVLLDTWEEFRRPTFDQQPRERMLLDAFAEPADDLTDVSPLARRLWRLPVGTLRQQIRQAVLAPGPVRYPLLSASA